MGRATSKLCLRVLWTWTWAVALLGVAAATGTGPSSQAAVSGPNAGGAPIKIGHIVDLSGPAADLGQYEKMGAELFVEQVNAAGGILGRRVQLITRDGKGNTSEAVNQARDLLYSQNIDFLFSGTNSAYALAISDIAKQARKIYFSQNANDEFTLVRGHRYVFRVPNVIALTQARAAAEFAARRFPEKKRYYLIAHDYAFGRTVVADFKTFIKEAVPDVDFVGEAYVKVTETDYNSYITAILQARPDVVFFAWQVGVPFFKQAAPYQLSRKVQLLSAYWGGVQDIMTLSKAELPVSAVVGGVPWYGIGTTANTEFVQAFRKKYGVPPKPSAYFDYVSLQVLAAGIRKAGRVDSEAVIEALEGLEVDTVLGKIKVRSVDHQGVTPYWLGTVKWDESLGIGVISDIVRLSTERFLPTEKEVELLRQGGR